MNISRYLCSIVVLLIGLVLILLVNAIYLPAPEGITEPWKFSAFSTAVSTMGLTASTLAYFGDGNFFKYYRYVFHLNHPTTPSEIPGSNIRSRVTTFDDITVRLYEPIKKKDGLAPALIFIHGGGFVVGSTETYDSLTRKIAEGLDMMLVSIEYRLAPEFKTPIQGQDNLKATRWFIQHAREFDVDANRIGIAGDSAGGLMSAYISQVVHDDQILPNLKFQGLIYPVTQMLDMYTPSYQKYDKLFGEKGIVSRKTVITMITSIIPNDGDLANATMTNMHTSSEFKRTRMRTLVNHDDIPTAMKDSSYYTPPSIHEVGDEQLWNKYQKFFLNTMLSPLLREDMTGLPPAYIITCGFDTMRDDGILYAKKLQRAGVETTLVDYESGFHGMFYEGRFFQFQLAQEALKKFIAHTKEALLRD